MVICVWCGGFKHVDTYMIYTNVQIIALPFSWNIEKWL